ncbi:MAG: DNA repair exonuclease [Candidatus Nitrosocaldus sp.]|nr:DNA repair exonuclease [Candidatus Nitrosocaldus sp.]MCS7140726.1 DNA repair exonuclease [Candidatus Nitrosocaldus sp.]MDW7999459.1 DNA repair exonuclease [Candidatus Nitrosocaldus sp.]MDW8275043.1 DNA repair exonuclease [Candidatus Nitrosocaldus sp.]
MQILHLSDTHLGCMQFNLREREDDVYDAFNEAVETAIRDKVDAVVHSGDIFHVPKPSGTAMLKLGEALKRLSEHNIRFFFTLGEHDISRVRDTPAPYVFHRLGMATYIGDGKPYTYRGLTLVGLHKHRRGEGEQLRERLRGITPSPSGARSILVLHQGLGEFHPYAYELVMDDLPAGFDYYAMGHLHDHAVKQHSNGGIVCYPGSIDPTPGESIREFRKGFCMVDLSGDEANVEFIQVQSTRKQLRYTVEYDELDGFIKDIEPRIRGLQKKPILALKVRGRSLDGASVARTLSRLNDICLYYIWETEEYGRGVDAGRVYDSRPDVDRELLGLAIKALGDEDAARFAIDELLELLNSNDTDGAVDLVWRRFEDMIKQRQ